MCKCTLTVTASITCADFPMTWGIVCNVMFGLTISYLSLQVGCHDSGCCVLCVTSVYLRIIVIIKSTWSQATLLRCCEGWLLEHLNMMEDLLVLFTSCIGMDVQLLSNISWNTWVLHGVMIQDGHYCTMLVGESVFQEFVLHSNCPDTDFELGGLSCCCVCTTIKSACWAPVPIF